MGKDDLAQTALSQMQDADPFGDYRLVSDGPAVEGIVLSLGGEYPMGSTHSIVVNASGWLAIISMERTIQLPVSEDRNLIGAIAAACLGVAQVFKIAIKMPPENYVRDGIFDMFRLQWADGSVQTPCQRS